MTPKDLLARFEPREVVAAAPRSSSQLGVIRFDPSGTMIAAGAFDGVLRRWDLAGPTPRELPALSGHHGWIQSVAFSRSGTKLGSGDSHGRLIVWDNPQSGDRPRWSIAAHDGWLRRLAISPDGRTIATCGIDRAVRFWSINDGSKQLEIQHQDDPYCVAFAPDGNSIVTGDLRGMVRQWDGKGKLIREFAAREMYLYERIQDVGGVRCIAFDQTGKLMAVGGGIPKSGGFVQGTWLIKIFETGTGKELPSIKGGNENDGFVLDMCWHPGGFLAAVASGQPGNGRFLFHRPGDAAPFFVSSRMPNCHSLDLHPNGRRFVVAATNANSAGNGRVAGKNGEYAANISPIHFWDLPGT